MIIVWRTNAMSPPCSVYTLFQYCLKHFVVTYYDHINLRERAVILHHCTPHRAAYVASPSWAPLTSPSCAFCFILFRSALACCLL
jgi:hypothetical protein